MNLRYSLKFLNLRLWCRLLAENLNAQFLELQLLFLLLFLVLNLLLRFQIFYSFIITPIGAGSFKTIFSLRKRLQDDLLVYLRLLKFRCTEWDALMSVLLLSMSELLGRNLIFVNYEYLLSFRYITFLELFEIWVLHKEQSRLALVQFLFAKCYICNLMLFGEFFR